MTEYAQYVDYTKMQGFKDKMTEIGRLTRDYALRRGFEIIDGYRASYWRYTGSRPHINRTLLPKDSVIRAGSPSGCTSSAMATRTTTPSHRTSR